MTYREISRKFLEIARKCIENRLMTGKLGNLSTKIDDDKVLITPSGFEKNLLKPNHLLIVDLDGRVHRGHLKPSIEIWTHLGVYKSRPDVNAVIHTHSPYATILAVLGESIPPLTVEFASIVGHVVPVTRYVPPGSKEMADEVVRVLGSDRLAVLVRNHGVFAVGDSLEEAYYVALSVEEESRIYFYTKFLAMVEPTILPNDEVLKLRSSYTSSLKIAHRPGS